MVLETAPSRAGPSHAGISPPQTLFCLCFLFFPPIQVVSRSLRLLLLYHVEVIQGLRGIGAQEARLTMDHCRGRRIRRYQGILLPSPPFSFAYFILTKSRTVPKRTSRWKEDSSKGRRQRRDCSVLEIPQRKHIEEIQARAPDWISGGQEPTTDTTTLSSRAQEGGREGYSHDSWPSCASANCCCIARSERGTGKFRRPCPFRRPGLVSGC